MMLWDDGHTGGKSIDVVAQKVKDGVEGTRVEGGKVDDNF